MQYKIITGQLEKGTQEQRAVFAQLLGEANLQYQFDLYFHWYNIAHEYGHCLLDYYHQSIGGVREEMLVNQFAVGYWAYMGYTEELSQLREMIRSVLKTIPNPVPTDQSFVDFFEQIWETALMSVSVYGYFQFNSVWMALQEMKDFSVVLEEMGIRNFEHTPMRPYKKYPIAAEEAANILRDIQSSFDRMEIEHLTADIELVDDPSVHCARNVDAPG